MSENTAQVSWEESPRRKYAAAVQDSLDLPVISVESVLPRLNDPGLADRYPGGYMSTRDYVTESVARSMRAGVYGPLTEEQEELFGPAAAAVADRFVGELASVLSGERETKDEKIGELAGEISTLVAEHTPGQRFAKLGGRPEAEQQALEQQYGSDAKFFLPPEGMQNHQALRVMELWSAASPDYVPAHTSSQVMRHVAGYTGPIWNAISGRPNRQIGQPWEDAATISSPDGKFQYAADLYRRADPNASVVDTQSYSGPDDPYRTSVFTKDGLPKYYKYDMPMGLGQFTELNQDFPLAKYKQNAKEYVANWGTNLTSDGPFMADASARADIRSHRNRTVPTIPDGLTAEQVRRLGDALDQSDSALTGINSSLVGPGFADAYNATLGNVTGPMKRTYPSLFVSSLLDVPSESVTDLPNAVINVAAPFASGALGAAVGGSLKTGGTNFIRTLARTPFRLADDIVEEGAETGVIGAPLAGNVVNFFAKGQDYNTLTGAKNPNDADFWQHRERKAEDAYQGQHDAAKEWRRLRQDSPPSTGRPTMTQMVRPPYRAPIDR
jgi:hypothetical protein